MIAALTISSGLLPITMISMLVMILIQVLKYCSRDAENLGVLQHPQAPTCLWQWDGGHKHFSSLSGLSCTMVCTLGFLKVDRHAKWLFLPYLRHKTQGSRKHKKSSAARATPLSSSVQCACVSHTHCTKSHLAREAIGPNLWRGYPLAPRYRLTVTRIVT